ncbi:hypothetical protein K501DRAFT_272039 [Backusella circina FSU 941]|nr:hypothetical protein K501DRAFT_272039 [Backusella circina FSU 941]
MFSYWAVGVMKLDGSNCICYISSQRLVRELCFILRRWQRDNLCVVLLIAAIHSMFKVWSLPWFVLNSWSQVLSAMPGSAKVGKVLVQPSYNNVLIWLYYAISRAI